MKVWVWGFIVKPLLFEAHLYWQIEKGEFVIKYRIISQNLRAESITEPHKGSESGMGNIRGHVAPWQCQVFPSLYGLTSLPLFAPFVSLSQTRFLCISTHVTEDGSFIPEFVSLPSSARAVNACRNSISLGDWIQLAMAKGAGSCGSSPPWDGGSSQRRSMCRGKCLRGEGNMSSVLEILSGMHMQNVLVEISSKVSWFQSKMREQIGKKLVRASEIEVTIEGKCWNWG